MLELDPARHDAALVVGMYRYVISTLSLPMRMMAYVAGFGGGKEEGIRLLQRAAAGGGEARTDALFALILVYNRERRFDEALAVLQQLRALYPRNRLVILEAGADRFARRPGGGRRPPPHGRVAALGQAKATEDTRRRAALAIQAGRLPGSPLAGPTPPRTFGRRPAAAPSHGWPAARGSSWPGSRFKRGDRGRPRPRRGRPKHSVRTEMTRNASKKPRHLRGARMAVKLKTWIWVVLGLAGSGVLCVIAMAGAGFYYFSQNIEARKASPAAAAAEFDAVRARFKGQQALIELDERGNFLRSNTDRPRPPTPAAPRRSTSSPSIPTMRGW